MKNKTIPANIARNIAESVWGTGGTKATRTNRQGAFYYSCSSHGGFVIDSDCLTQKEIAALAPYVTPFEAELYEWRDVSNRLHKRLNWYGIKRGFKYRASSVKITEKRIYLLEEDCNWSLAYTQTGIRLIEKDREEADTMQEALDTFEYWIMEREHKTIC